MPWNPFEDEAAEANRGKRREAGPVFIMLRSGRVVFVTDKDAISKHGKQAFARRNWPDAWSWKIMRRHCALWIRCWRKPPCRRENKRVFPIAGIVPNKPWLYKNGLSYWMLVLRPGWKDLPASKNEVDAIVRLLDSEDVETSVYTGKEGSEESFRGLSKRKASVLYLARMGSWWLLYRNTRIRFMKDY